MSTIKPTSLLDRKTEIQNRTKRYDYQDQVPREYKEMAAAMEANFVNFMVGEMKKSIHKTTPDSTATQYYESLLDQQRSETISATRDGVGLQRILLDEIVPDHIKQAILRNIDAEKKLPKQKLSKLDAQKYERIKNSGNNLPN